MNIDDIKLIAGMGNRDAKELCVMSLAALIANEPHTDHPVCACPVLTAVAVQLNDGLWWASDDERTVALKPLAAKLVGTRGTDALALRRADVFVNLALRVWTPRALDYAASIHPIEMHCEVLREHASKLRGSPTAAHAHADADAAYAAAAAAYAAVATSDKYLLLSASLALEVLRELKSPGVEWIEYKGKD